MDKLGFSKAIQPFIALELSWPGDTYKHNIMKQFYPGFLHMIGYILLAIAIRCTAFAIKGRTRRAIGFSLTGLVLIFFLVTKLGGTTGASLFQFNTLRVFTTALTLSAILVVGLRAICWQYQHSSDSKNVRQLIAAMGVYQALFLVTTLLYFSRIFQPTAQAFTSQSLFIFSMIFAVSLAVTLMATLVERSRVEQAFFLNEKRLQSVMENAPVMVLELEAHGQITYINDFGLSLLGYENVKDLIGISWFNSFLMPSDIALLKKLYAQIFSGNLVTATFKNAIKCKNGNEIIISWVNFVCHAAEGGVKRVICIGRDISGEESANKLVAQMQKELEKENIILEEPAQFELEENVVGKSKAFNYAIQRARQVAITHAPVLLEGETGVGKEVFANIIHKNSSRSKMPFIKVNCGALPKELIEDELFGHEKGAFTSAIQARKGRFELADGGTIFLDEIGELPIDMQPKLLRVLQNGEFERVGGQKTIKVDVRLLAATNRNLLDEIEIGNFREDLYYRLNVFPITIPPLRKREEDLPDLIQYFIATKCKEYGKVLEKISSADLQRLISYRWPGNIRELKNVIERAVIVSEGHILKLNWWQNSEAIPEIPSGKTLEKVEYDHIMTIMEKCHWKINGDNGAAEILNMHPNTLRSKMKRLGIIRPQAKPAPELAHSNFYPKESLG
jgi:PAS domain S-box-containing protein